MNTIQEVIMCLSKDVLLAKAKVSNVIDSIINTCNTGDVWLIAGSDNIAYENQEWFVGDKYRFTINNKHIIVGNPCYISATGVLNIFNKHLVVCDDSTPIIDDSIDWNAIIIRD